MPTEPLVCPRCASTHPLDLRFCPSCGMPLVYSGATTGEDRPVSDAHARARKIKPQYAEGELVRVASARHLPEAELLQGLLLEEGVPSILRQTPGFDIPELLSAGPRDVLVPQSGLEVARDVLRVSEPERSSDVPASISSPWRMLAGLLLLLMVVAAVVYVAWIIGR